MKNLQINDNDLIGNKFNGHDLHFYLREKGWDSSQLVANKESDDENTFLLSNNNLFEHYRVTLMQLEREYSVHALSYPFMYDVMKNKLFLDTDIVHYHLIHNYLFSLNLFPILTRLKPTVWSLHDPWALGGHCIHHFECEKWKENCGDCSKLDAAFKMNKDNTALNFELKRVAIQSSNISVIVASNWMKKKVEQSPIFKDKPVYLVTFGINQNLFKAENNQAAKKKLGIDKNSAVLMLRADPSEFKGFDIIKESLIKIKSEKQITIITVGQKGLLDKSKDKYKILEYDWIKDDNKLIELYQACDIFLMPSRMETFGMMAIEAMSCGKVVLSIEGTALPDTINAPECGIVTKPDADSYAQELQRLLDNPSEIEERGLKSLEFAKKNYNHEIYLERIINVYKEVMANHKMDNEAAYVLEQLKKHMQQQPTEIKKEAIFHKKHILLRILYPTYRPILKLIRGKKIIKKHFDPKYKL